MPTSIWIAVIATFAVLTYVFVASLPSLHHFTPNPDHPRECVHCGRREDVHKPRGDNNER